MRLFRVSLLSAALVAGAAALAVPTDAHASVAIAVGFEALVKDADTVAVIVPVEQTSVWEDGRIYTYTRVRVEQGIAGEFGTGAEGWVRTMGGVVGKIGQLVDGEPVLTPSKKSLLFLRHFRETKTFEVSARSQGQYPVVLDDGARVAKVVRSANVGMLLPPKKISEATKTSGTTTQSAAVVADAHMRLASEVIHDRRLDEVARDIAAAWRRLHPEAARVK